MKIRKFNRDFQPVERDLTTRQRAVLAATCQTKDKTLGPLRCSGVETPSRVDAGNQAVQSVK